MDENGGPADLLRRVLQVLYPGLCLLCGRPLTGGVSDAPLAPVCPSCRRLLNPVDAPRRCRVCSLPLISETGLCSRCRSRRFHFVSSFSLFVYGEAVRELIYQLKFANRRSLVPLFAAVLEPLVRESFPELPIVPVPGNPLAVRRRGWDPMVEIARRLARRCRRRLLCLLRRRAGAPQKSLGYEDRILNLRGTISLRGTPPPQVLLLDDIFTTGATADECARVIRGGGGRIVRVLTVAID
jgi:ComF family protein